MKIIVCIKIVPDISVVNFDFENGSFDPDDLVYMINPQDMVALEAALCISETNSAVEVTCLSVGLPVFERHLRTCLSHGGDRAILIRDKRLTDWDAQLTAKILAAAAKKLDFDLILCGHQSLDSEDGIVGPALAGLLNLPLVSQITRLEMAKDLKSAGIHQALEKGERSIQQCSLPALFTVHPVLNQPRQAHFPSALKALKTRIPLWDIDELGLEKTFIDSQKGDTSGVRFTLPRPRPKVTFRVGDQLPPAERMKLLVSGGPTNRKLDILEGDPDLLGKTIVRLIENRRENPVLQAKQ